MNIYLKGDLKRSRVLGPIGNMLLLAVTLMCAASVFPQESTVDILKSKEPFDKGLVVAKAVSKTDASETTASTERNQPEISNPRSVHTVREYVPDLRSEHQKGRSPFADVNNSASPKTPAPAAADDDRWHVSFAPYIFATGLTGTIGARGRTSDIDLSFSDIFHSLDIGLMGALELRKRKLIVVNDIMWIKLEEERDTPGGLYSTAKLGVNMVVWNPSAGYRLVEREGGSFDVLGGVRLTSVEVNLDFRAGILPAFDVSQRKTWVAPVIGAHGLANLSPKVFLSTIFDIGGGFGTHVTGQFYGGAGYRITSKIALVGGYRYMKNDYDDGNGFIFNTQMSGLLLGARFEF